MQKQLEQIITEASVKFNLPEPVIKLILDSQLRVTRDSIKQSNTDYTSEKLPVIMWPKFGKYVPLMNRYNKTKEIVNNKKQNNE